VTTTHDEGPPFETPWQARAFALAVALRDGGHLSWQAFQQRVADEIAADPDGAGGYYEHWLSALEALADHP
jgi:nitrile hydratase accessory protein